MKPHATHPIARSTPPNRAGAGAGIRRMLGSLAAALAIAGVSAEARAGDPPLEDYVVQPGDTCYKIATRKFGNGKRYDIIHEHNDLGPPPHRLTPGQVLKLPTTDKRPDAEVTRTQRKVRARAGSTETWSEADPGLDLYRGWRVNTLDQSAAEVTFQDQSAVQLRENTLVIIYGGAGTQFRRQTTEAQLEHGTLRSRLGELAGGGSGQQLNVRTPASQAKFEDTEALVTVQDDGTTLVGNHGEGKADVTAAGRRVSVGPKMGSKVKKGKPPSPPKPLPPAPEWAAGPQTFAGIAGFAGGVSGSWGAVDVAKSYLVQIAADEAGDQLISTVTVPAAVTKFEARGLPPGDYWAAVSTIDDDGFESPASARRKLTVVGGTLALPGGGEPVMPALDEIDPKGPMPAPRVLPGTTLDVPAELSCGLAGSERDAWGSKVTLLGSGPTEIQCADAAGNDVPGFSVHVAEVEVAAGDDATWPSEVTRGETTTIRVTAESDPAPPEALVVRPTEGLVVDSVTPVGPGAWDVVVSASDDAPERSGLALAFGEDAEPFRTLPVRVPPAPAAPAPMAVAADEGPMFELGLAGGIFFPSKNHALGQAGVVTTHEPFAVAAPKFDLRFSYLPLRWVGLEFEGGAGFARLQSGPKARLLGMRGHVLGQLPYRVTPIAYVGGGAVILDSALDAFGRDVRAGMHFGLGMKAHLTRTLALRLDVRDTVLRGHMKTFSNNFEVTLGISAVFGRRSAGRHATPAAPEEP